jgi:spermidine synthase
LVLGSGGGIDVVTLLLWDYQAITAVEINPDFVDIVKEWEKYNGGIYNDHPRIRLVEGGGPILSEKHGQEVRSHPHVSADH